MQQMGVSLNPLDWFSSQSSLDIEHGDKVLQAYYDSAAVFPSNFNFASYDDFRASMGGDVFVGALGANVRINMHPGLLDLVYFPYDDAAKRVSNLASTTQGLANGQQINQAAIDTSVDALSAITDNITTGIVSTSKWLKYAPWIAAAGAAIYFVGPKLLVAGLKSRANPLKKYPKKVRRGARKGKRFWNHGLTKAQAMKVSELTDTGGLNLRDARRKVLREK